MADSLCLRRIKLVVLLQLQGQNTLKNVNQQQQPRGLEYRIIAVVNYRRIVVLASTIYRAMYVCLVSRDGFGRPVPRQLAHLHTQAELCLLPGFLPISAAASIYLF